MEFKLGSHKKEWAETKLAENADEARISINDEDNRRLSQFVVDLLLSENIIVLTGLGTSLSALKNDKAKGIDFAPAPKMIDLWNSVKNKDENKFNEIITLVKYDQKLNGVNIELLLSRCKLFQKLEPSASVETFLKMAEQEVVNLCDFVDDSVKLESHEMFLRKVARRGSRLPRTQIYTTNYDLCFEKAASRTRFIVSDGFSYAEPPEFDGMYFNYDIVNRGGLTDHTHPDFVSNVFQLHKLHGSINWQNKEGKIIKTSQRSEPCIIYPQDGKYESSYSAPYLELMGRFQSSLRQQHLGLLIIGFGFNDNHITHPIIQLIKSNVHSKVLIVDPSLKDSKNEYIHQIKNLADSGDWRIGLISDTFEEFVKFLPDLMKESEMERHYKRIEGIK